MPFAVVGSNTVVESSGRKVRGRVYPWGVVEGKSDVEPCNCELNKAGDFYLDFVVLSLQSNLRSQGKVLQ